MRNLHELLGDQGSGQSDDENGPAVADKRVRTSRSRKRRCPPRVRTAVKRPARAHRVTVALSTPNKAATSAGVSSGSTTTVGRVIRVLTSSRVHGRDSAELARRTRHAALHPQFPMDERD